MGLLKGVIEGSLETAYRSLKYNNDSNQPYVVVPIPDYTDESGMNFALRAPDFILRQGALDTTSVNVLDRRNLPWWFPGAVSPNALNPFTVADAQVDINVPTDTLRIGKFLFDDKSIAGALFSAKQILLERTRVNAPGGGRRVYLPTSTILQTSVNQFGIHLDKTGLDPLDFDRRGYYKATYDNEFNLGYNGNRLSLIYQTKQFVSSNPSVQLPIAAKSLYDIDITDPEYLYSYLGGPKTLGGIGKTKIKIDAGYGDITARTNNYNPGKLRPQDRNTYTFGSTLLGDLVDPLVKTIAPYLFTDFRKTINESIDPTLSPSKQVLPYTDYRAFNRIVTYQQDVPTTFSTPDAQKAAKLNPIGNTLSYDGINKLGILRKRSGFNVTDTGKVSDPEITVIEKEEALIAQTTNQDLIPFYFQIINNNSDQNTDADWFLFFRAYLNNMSDNFKGDWQSFKYIGRAENFYKYSGFSRDVSLSFTVYAHSYSEMKPIYEKLNYLVGVTAPSYSSYGYMRGNFVNLRVGDYLNDVPGIITNIGLKPSFEGGWDIGKNADGTRNKDIKQLPKLIEVDLSFIPIHEFTPSANRQGYIG